MKKSTSAIPPVRYAVVGLGNIAQTAVLPAFKHAKENSELVALVSGHREKRAALAKKYRVPHTFGYDAYPQLLKSGLIDAVYICLPNDLHRAYAEAALRSGINVLCEKPLALTEEDCRVLTEAAEAGEAQLMTAYRLHFDEANMRAVELAKKKIGEPRIFNSTFTMQIDSRRNIRLQAERGGGPLWDIGIYCINAARYLFREEPIEVIAVEGTGRDPRFKDVAEATSVTLKFPNGKLATFTCSFGAASCAAFDLIGTEARVHMEAAYDYAYPRELTFDREYQKKIEKFGKVDQFAPEILHFSECVQRGTMPEPSGFEGLADVRIIVALLESARTGRRISLLEPTPRITGKPRPSAKQARHVPPVTKPRLIDAPPPSR